MELIPQIVVHAHVYNKQNAHAEKKKQINSTQKLVFDITERYKLV